MICMYLKIIQPIKGCFSFFLMARYNQGKKYEKTMVLVCPNLVLYVFFVPCVCDSMDFYETL